MVPVRTPRIRKRIRQGAVFMMQHRDVRSPLSHFLVVVNRDPLSDEVLLFSVITSNVDKRKQLAESRNQPPQTIVDFGPSDYSPLSHQSCIDCNDLKTLSAEEFEQILLMRSAAQRDDLPPAVLSRVIAGILASPLVKGRYKALVSPHP